MKEISEQLEVYLLRNEYQEDYLTVDQFAKGRRNIVEEVSNGNMICPEWNCCYTMELVDMWRP